MSLIAQTHTTLVVLSPFHFTFGCVTYAFLMTHGYECQCFIVVMVYDEEYLFSTCVWQAREMDISVACSC